MKVHFNYDEGHSKLPCLLVDMLYYSGDGGGGASNYRRDQFTVDLFDKVFNVFVSTLGNMIRQGAGHIAPGFTLSFSG